MNFANVVINVYMKIVGVIQMLKCLNVLFVESRFFNHFVFKIITLKDGIKNLFRK